MTVVRTILAIAIALSVAMLPVSGSMAATHAVMVASTCDDCDAAHAACDKMKFDCRANAACALKCFQISGTTFAVFAIEPIVAPTPVAVTIDRLTALITKPPPHPPRA